MSVRATEQLKRDHRAVRELFNEYLSTRGKELELLREIRARLEAHRELEETLFYPALAEQGQDELVHDAEAEHREVQALLDELTSLRPGEARFDLGMRQLIQRVEAHVAHEEAVLFHAARRELGDGGLEALGDEMDARRPPAPPPREHHA